MYGQTTKCNAGNKEFLYAERKEFSQREHKSLYLEFYCQECAECLESELLWQVISQDRIIQLGQWKWTYLYGNRKVCLQSCCDSNIFRESEIIPQFTTEIKQWLTHLTYEATSNYCQYVHFEDKIDSIMVSWKRINLFGAKSKDRF